METGTIVTWDNNIILGHTCEGLYLREIDAINSEVICTSIGPKMVRMKVIVQTSLLKAI